MNLKIISIAALFFTYQVGAIECDWYGKKLMLGESIWVSDEFLVENERRQLEEQGLSKEVIQKRLRHSDWNGFRVICQASVVLNPNPQFAGDILKQVEGVTVVNQYSRDLHQLLIESPGISLKP